MSYSKVPSGFEAGFSIALLLCFCLNTMTSTGYKYHYCAPVISKESSGIVNFKFLDGVYSTKVDSTHFEALTVGQWAHLYNPTVNCTAYGDSMREQELLLAKEKYQQYIPS